MPPMGHLKVSSDSGNGSSPSLYYKESASAHIDPSSDASLMKWEEILHLSRKELLAAVNQFGTEVRLIRRGLLAQKSEDEAA